MADAATYVTEMFVGLACLALAVAMRLRPRAFRVLRLLLAVAGVVAVAHATVELVSR